ncbi:ABC transporter permease [Halobacillus massiliensis]|uniref:ABC transporter permease n=1 Tax=Halobacillus massiliensis TaxID=1926286 RepID=UPI0009E43092|nr:FtsX-like permease family protein [Halobacillus massiliensis]
MSINQLILRSLKKNIKNYYLYVFALIFTVALYFAFVTLQYDPAMDEAGGTLRGAAGIRTASVLLIAIAAIFVLYANKLFIKRRSKEIGLYQLIGMTKNRIFFILSAENFLIYSGSIILGTLLGFSISKLTAMILFKITGVDAVASLHFSEMAFLQTVALFLAIYLLILLMNYVFIKRQSILSLFHFTSKTEERIKRISIWEILMGVLGLGLIITGYYVSSKLFGGDFTSIKTLFMAMIFILAAVIIGTYFFYKGSVRFLANLIRKNKNGYLNINEVLSLTSIMFRMKSNSLLLTIITTVSALAIGLLSLSYISYYSAVNGADNNVPADFSFLNMDDAESFASELEEQDIEYSQHMTEFARTKVGLEDIMSPASGNLADIREETNLAVIPDTEIEGIKLNKETAIFLGYNDAVLQLMDLEDSGDITIHLQNQTLTKKYLGMEKNAVLPNSATWGMPVLVVDKDTFDAAAQHPVEDIEQEYTHFIGLDLKDEGAVNKADEIFQSMPLSEEYGNESQAYYQQMQKENMGLGMFIVGFLGLTFLITSGCILYFKQMEESEEEKSNYTILRKLGFTRGDLIRGITGKQVFNFGIPLIVGLFHSYFAVQSGWFLFGTELWAPMFIVMGVYTVLYSIFGLLSVMYYKKVIHSSL